MQIKGGGNFFCDIYPHTFWHIGDSYRDLKTFDLNFFFCLFLKKKLTSCPEIKIF